MTGIRHVLEEDGEAKYLERRVSGERERSLLTINKWLKVDKPNALSIEITFYLENTRCCVLYIENVFSIGKPNALSGDTMYDDVTPPLRTRGPACGSEHYNYSPIT
jgi:hypothetical protein